jgi:hypothetical protein
MYVRVRLFTHIYRDPFLLSPLYDSSFLNHSFNVSTAALCRPAVAVNLLLSGSSFHRLAHCSYILNGYG